MRWLSWTTLTDFIYQDFYSLVELSLHYTTHFICCAFFWRMTNTTNWRNKKNFLEPRCKILGIMKRMASKYSSNQIWMMLGEMQSFAKNHLHSFRLILNFISKNSLDAFIKVPSYQNLNLESEDKVNTPGANTELPMG